MNNEDLIAELHEDNQLTSKEKSDLQVKAEEIKEVASEKAAQISAVAKEQFADKKEQLAGYQETLEEYVKRNPTTAVAIAAGVGFFLGLVSRRK